MHQGTFGPASIATQEPQADSCRLRAKPPNSGLQPTSLDKLTAPTDRGKGGPNARSRFEREWAQRGAPRLDRVGGRGGGGRCDGRLRPSTSRSRISPRRSGSSARISPSSLAEAYGRVRSTSPRPPSAFSGQDAQPGVAAPLPGAVTKSLPPAGRIAHEVERYPSTRATDWSGPAWEQSRSWGQVRLRSSLCHGVHRLGCEPRAHLEPGRRRRRGR